MKKKLMPFVAAMFLVLLSASSVYAQTWNGTSGTNSWSTPGNWMPNTVPNSAGATASINAFNLTTNQLITLDGGSETVGTIDLGSTGGAFTYTIELGTLILNNNGGGAAINESSTADGDTISAAISMADAGGLTISSAAATGKTFTLSGGVTSTTNSNLVLDANGAGTIVLSTNVVDNQGTITNDGSGTGMVTLSGGIGSNVSAVTESSTNSALTISGGITVNAGGTTITNNSPGAVKLMITGGVTGTGNLTLANDTTTNGGIEANTGGAIDNSGTITNDGTGTGNVSISTGIGSAVSTITESSTNSALTIQDVAITVGTNGTTLINSSPGTAVFTVTSGVSGTGNLILDNNGTTASGIILSSISPDNNGSIINSGTGSGSTKLNIGLGSNITNVTEDGASSLLMNTSNTAFTGTVTDTTGTITLGSVIALDAANTVTVNGGTLDLDGHSETIAGLNGSGGIVTNSVTSSSQTLTLGGGGTYSYGGVITAGNTADLNLVISNGTVQTLSGANTYTGTTTINSGTLNVAGSLASGTTTVNGGTLNVTGSITSGGTVSVMNGATLSGTGSIGAVTIAGGGIINLQGGGVTNNLTATSLTTTGAGGNIVISINVGSDGTSSLLTLSGINGITLDNDFTVNIAGLTGATIGTTYTFVDASSGGGLESGYFTLGAVTAGGAITSSDTFTFNTIDGGTEETVTITASGGSTTPSVAYWTGADGTNTWTDPNNFSTTSGTNTPASGVPGSVTDVVFGTTSPTPTNLATTLDAATTINSLTFNTSSDVSIASGAGGTNSTLTLEAATTSNNISPNGITVASTAGTDSISANVVLGTNQTWTNNSANTFTVSGSIGDNSNNFTLTTAGSGTIALTTNNTYGGGTIIDSGTLQVGASQALGTGTNVTLSGVSSSSNATLDYNVSGGGTLSQNITVTNGDNGEIDNTSGGVLDLTGGISKDGSVLTLSGGQFVVSGVISGNSNHSDLVVGTNTYSGNGGAATVALTNTNTYNGPTEINDGSTLLTGTNNALPNAYPSDVTFGSASDNDVTNTLDLLGTSETVASLDVGSTSSNVINQVISSDGSVGSPAIGSSTSSLTGNLTVDYTTTSTNDTFSGSLGGNGGLNNFGLTKSGAGTLVLSGVNTYTGATTVTGGVLEVTGSTLSSAVGVGNGTANSGTLSGSGSVGDITLNAGGTVAPGGAFALGPHLSSSNTVNNVLTGTSLTINGGTLSYNLYSETPGTGTSDNPAGSTLIDLGPTGDLTFSDSLSSSNQLVFDFNNTGIGGNGTVVDNTLSGTPNVYDLIDFGSGLTETQLTTDLDDGDIDIENLGGGQSYSGLLVVTTNEDGGYILQLDVVPEPSTWALFALGLGLLFFVVCKRWRLTRKPEIPIG